MAYRPYTLPCIILAGAPFEIGLQYGRKARGRIRRHFANQCSLMAARAPATPDWWRRAVHEHLAPFAELAPYYIEEMHGVAAGAGLEFEEVLLLNVRDELAPPPVAGPSGAGYFDAAQARPIGEGRVEACTSFGCSGEVTRNGQPILGQTKDTATISQDLYVVIAMRQQGRPDLLQMPYAGELGVFGVSSSGMAAFGNSIYTRGKGQGRLPWALFRRLVLEAESVDALLRLVAQYGIRTVGNLTIGDRAGRVVAIENTDHGYGVVEAQDGILTHANHICTPELVCYEDYAEPERTGSHLRQARLRELLEADRGRVSAPLALRALMDHSNYPGSICRHPSVPGDIGTTAALVVEPGAGLMHVIRGQACHGWPKTYSL